MSLVTNLLRLTEPQTSWPCTKIINNNIEMRAILTLENGERVTVPFELEKSRKRKFIYVDDLESDALKNYNRLHKIKAIKVHILRN